MGNIVMKGEASDRGEIVVYQLDEVLKVDVFINDETVWLTQEQIAQIFSVGRPAITKHIRNIYKCGELEENSTCSILEHMGNAGQQAYQVKYFNLDMILSVGYRVNSKSAIYFRRWASNILKEYMLRGYSANQRLIDLEGRVNAKLLEHELRLDEYGKKIDFFVRTSLPPVEGTPAVTLITVKNADRHETWPLSNVRTRSPHVSGSQNTQRVNVSNDQIKN